MEGYTAEKRKTKKKKQNIITKPTRKNYKQDHDSIIEIFQKNKIKKEIMQKFDTKLIQTHI